MGAVIRQHLVARQHVGVGVLDGVGDRRGEERDAAATDLAIPLLAGQLVVVVLTEPGVGAAFGVPHRQAPVGQSETALKAIL